MEGRALMLMAGVGLLVFCGLRKNYRNGLALAVALLVALPASLRLELPGGLPEFTVQRMILLIVLGCALFGSGRTALAGRVPLIRPMLFLLAAQFISLCVSSDGKASFKSFLAFSLEVVAFYVVISKSLSDRDRILRIMRILVTALAVVAASAWFERRWDFNPSQYLVTGDGSAGVDVAATFPHRIIFGYAMAMAVPMLLALIQRESRSRQRRRLWILVFLATAACYFSNSRGPWIGLATGAGVMTMFGSPALRRKILLLGCVAFVVLLSRPGVRETLASAFENTFYADSLKGKSYSYRWKLWHVAYSEITQSPTRLLLGYGGLSTEKMDLSHYFDRESGGTTNALGYTSWDNQLACNLIEFGIVGFLIEVVLLALAMQMLLRNLRRARAPDRTMILAFACACFIYMFALTNVYIFSPQLKFLFWTFLACGIRWGREARRERSVATSNTTASRQVAAPVGGRMPERNWNN